MSFKNWWNRKQIKERNYKRLRFINRLRIGWLIVGIGLITAFVGAMIPTDYFSTIYGLGAGVIIFGFILMFTFGSEDIYDEETFRDGSLSGDESCDTDSIIP